MTKSVQLLNDEKNYDFLGLLNSDTKLEVEKMSDFERFALFCDALPLVSGSRVGKEFVDALAFDLNSELPRGICLDREAQKTVWRRINGDVALDTDIAKLCTVTVPKKLYATKKSSVLFLNAVLESEELTKYNLEAFIDNLSKQDGIALNMGNFIYSRPDEYHSALVYDKIAAGQTCTKEEISLLISWIICRLLMRKNARLYFVVDGDMAELEKLLKLFEDRLLYPHISICFGNSELCDSVSRICLEARRKNISSEIIIPEETDKIFNFIKALAYELPLTRISICDFFATDKQRACFAEAMESFMKSAGGI